MPKQFHALGSENTLLQEAILRSVASDDLVPAGPILICSRAHAAMAEDQLRSLGVTATALVLEPFGRNTAVVAAMASLLGEEADPEALILLMPADHVIGDREAFSAGLVRAAPVARSHIVVFGVHPTGPETGYGYIESGDLITGVIRKVVRFAEKPDLETAVAYLAGGRHSWNAGIFLFSPRIMLEELERFAPDVLDCARQALAKARRCGKTFDLDAASFGACRSISIDYAVMEKTDRAAVAPLGVDWADVGSWSELWRLGPHDEQGNRLSGDALVIDTEGALVWAGSKTVGVIGVKDLIIVQTEDAVIVLPKSRAQDVKLLVEQIKARGAR
jgi:mannose-1-phosphate guanylyltransferase/mannose-6-phosphate isomerase